jgi:hypothetical protein
MDFKLLTTEGAFASSLTASSPTTSIKFHRASIVVETTYDLKSLVCWIILTRSFPTPSELTF